MTSFKINKITIIGAGNVGTNLAFAFYKLSIPVFQVFDIHENNALDLASKVNSEGISKFLDIKDNSDLYIISVPDDAIKGIVDSLKINKKSFVVHTSGTTSIDILKQKFENCGVFYPLQTFLKTNIVEFSNIPICIEASNSLLLSKLNQLASNLSLIVSEIDSNKRKTIHLAAVFACNFVNYMYSLSEDILKKEGVSLDILRPLIAETALKVQTLSPSKVQTGPAKRNDKKTMEAHNALLGGYKNASDVYSLLSQQIIDFYL